MLSISPSLLLSPQDKIGTNIGKSAWNQGVTAVEDAANLIFSSKGRKEVILKAGHSFVNFLTFNEDLKAGRISNKQLLNMAQNYVSEPENLENLAGRFVLGWITNKGVGILSNFEKPIPRIKHIDIGGYGKYPNAQNFTLSAVDYNNRPIPNLVQGLAEQTLKKLESNSVLKITIENTPYHDAIMTEATRVLARKGTLSITTPSFSEGTFKKIAERFNLQLKSQSKN
jgi:hypothetical protein